MWKWNGEKFDEKVIFFSDKTTVYQVNFFQKCFCSRQHDSLQEKNVPIDFLSQTSYRLVEGTSVNLSTFARHTIFDKSTSFWI